MGEDKPTYVINSDKNGYKLVSLFSGAGGLDIGFSLEGGYNFLFANDVIEAPANSYSHNSSHRILNLGAGFGEKAPPPSYVLGDVEKLKFECLDVEDLDVPSGGPPCQDFSLMRGPDDERQGIIVTRGKLYSHFARGLIHLQPKVFVFENVPGLVSANDGEAINIIKGDFTNLKAVSEEIGREVGNGYSGFIENYHLLFSDIVDSANVGVPQHRKRLIIIGVRADLVDSDAGTYQELKNKVASILRGDNMLFHKYPLTPLEVFEGRPLSELRLKYREIMLSYQAVEIGRAHV